MSGLLLVALLFLVALLALGTPSFAQTVVQFPQTVSVAGTAQSQTVTVTVTAPMGGTVGSIQVLTQGAPNLDFQQGTGVSSCQVGGLYNNAQQCTVNVSFLPKYPGLRHGAVVLAAGDGTVLGTTYLEGTASGPLSVLVPGVINTVAGDVNWIYSGDNVPATSSSIFLPMGEVTDGAGNLYIADTNNFRVRRVDAQSGLITTVAGGFVQGYLGDGGKGVDAELSSPTALAMDGAGNLYIADSGSLVIRMLNLGSGIITTIAGVGGPSDPAGDGGPAMAAHLTAVSGMAFDGQHALYLADTGNNEIRKIDLSSGIITRFAGTGSAAYTGDGGAALAASFNSPQGLAFGPDGSLYVADVSNNVIRRITTDGNIATVAGGGVSGLGDGSGALQAQLTLPAAVAVDQAGNLYIADTGANRIRKVTVADGKINTVAGNGNEAFAGDGANADQSELYGPYSIYYDGQGNLFVSDMFHNRVREISGSAATFQYDPIRVNRTSPPKLETVENDGNDDLALTAPAFVNASLDQATTTCTLPQTLTKGISCVLGVAFSPTVLGNNVQGTVTLSSNAADSPAVVSLSGQVLSVDPTATLVTSSLNPSGAGATVAFTAHVTTQGSSMTGTVEFFDGGASMGKVPLSDTGAMGTAMFSTASLTLGAHSITAVYSGDATNAASTSPVLTQSVKQQTTLMLNSTPNPSVEGGAVVLVAKAAASGVVPTGTVTFADGSTTLGTGTLDGSGTATLTVATFTIGQHNLSASYSGDTNNGPSGSNTIQQTVNGQGSSITVSTSKATVQVGASVSFSATVTGANSIIPTGTVAFKDGAATLGTATASNGVAGFTTAGLAPGTHNITAVYQGDAHYGGSTSMALLETVQQLGTVTVVSSNSNPSAAGAAVLLTAAVTGATTNSPESAGGPISGTVTFLNGGASLGTGTISAGLATVSVTTLPLGASNITAVYNGNTNYLTSTSTPLVQTVVQAETTTALASSENPSTVEDAITLTATVATKGGHASGVVTFSSDGAVIGQGTLNGQGVATLTYATLPVGQHNVVASYAGDAQNLASVSPLVMQKVLLHPSAVVLTSSATSLSGGQQVTLIAVIQWTGTIVPTGTMTFQSGTITLGASPVDGTGVAALTINPQNGQTTNITATYSGDAVFSGSASSGVAVTVGAPPQFSLATNTTTLILPHLDHTTISLTASSEKGFSDMLTLGCAGLPQAATCTFDKDQVMLPANGSMAVNVVVDTGSPLTAGSVAKNEAPGSSSLVAICGLPMGILGGLLFWKGRRRGVLGGVLLLLCALGASAGLSGCGSLNINGTPAGTYHFQITAAAQGTGVIQAVNMTMTVGN